MRKVGLVAALVVVSTALSATPAPATFPGQNGKIVFQHQEPDDSDDIYVVNPDGTGLKNLTGTPDSDEQQPAWSSDGSAIAFLRALAGGHSELWLMDANGKGYVQLADYFHHEPRHPAWSRDSETLAINFSLRAMPAGTIMPSPQHEHRPTWSPEEDAIAFNRAICASCAPGIRSINADGSGAQTLTSGSDEEPNWSPDGSQIIFNRQSSTLFTVPATGGSATPCQARCSPTTLPFGRRMASGLYSQPNKPSSGLRTGTSTR